MTTNIVSISAKEQTTVEQDIQLTVELINNKYTKKNTELTDKSVQTLI